MAKNLVLPPSTQIWVPKIFLWILSLLDVRNCCKLSLYAISGKTNEPNLREWQKKNQFQAQFWLVLGQIWSLKIFFVGFVSTDVRNCRKLSLYAISRKTIENKLEKMTKNLVSDPILAPLAQICPLKFFSWVLPLLDIMQFQEKLMNQT